MAISWVKSGCCDGSVSQSEESIRGIQLGLKVWLRGGNSTDSGPFPFPFPFPFYPFTHSPQLSSVASPQRKYNQLHIIYISIYIYIIHHIY